MPIYNDGKLGPLTTKGDIRVFDGSDEVRLPIGPNTQVITADSVQSSGVKWAAAGGAGAVTRAGGNTTEATTTSTTVVNLLTAATLSIAAATPFLTRSLFRKSAGAGVAAGLGLTLNTTTMAIPDTSALAVWDICGGFSAADRAESGEALCNIGATVTSYTFGTVVGQYSTHITGGAAAGVVAARSADGDRPTVAITDVVIRAISGNALVTVGADELHIYIFSTS